MFFSKSIGLDDEEFVAVAAAAKKSPAGLAGESEWVESLKAGDENAFEMLITRYSPGIYGLLFRLTQNEADASDLVQETFMRALRSVKDFRGDSSLKTWLYRIAINQSRNRFRGWRRRRGDMTISLDSTPHEGLTIAERTASGDKSPEEATLQSEREFALGKALAELPKKFREVVILRDVEGLAYEEISELLDTNIGTVKSRLARGREELRRILKDY